MKRKPESLETILADTCALYLRTQGRLPSELYLPEAWKARFFEETAAVRPYDMHPGAPAPPPPAEMQCYFQHGTHRRLRFVPADTLPGAGMFL